jgi:hypothetical protein
MDWRCGSSGRVPALQVQSPEFKPQKKKSAIGNHYYSQGADIRMSSLNIIKREKIYKDILAQSATKVAVGTYFLCPSWVLALQPSYCCLAFGWSRLGS